MKHTYADGNKRLCGKNDVYRYDKQTRRSRGKQKRIRGHQHKLGVYHQFHTAQTFFRIAADNVSFTSPGLLGHESEIIFFFIT